MCFVEVVEHFNVAEDNFAFIRWWKWRRVVVDVDLTLVSVK